MYLLLYTINLLFLYIVIMSAFVSVENLAHIISNLWKLDTFWSKVNKHQTFQTLLTLVFT